MYQARLPAAPSKMVLFSIRRRSVRTSRLWAVAIGAAVCWARSRGLASTAASRAPAKWPASSSAWAWPRADRW
jgi:hypothetical protein